MEADRLAVFRKIRNIHGSQYQFNERPEMVDDRSSFLEIAEDERDRMIQKRTKTDRPLGGEEFVLQLEALMGREMRHL